MLINKLNNLQYIVLPSSLDLNSSPEIIDIHNKAYSYWSHFWTEIYSSAGSIASFKKDDFFRQKYILLLVHESEIVAMHLYSFFNLKQKSVVEHSYFNFFNKTFFDKLVFKNIHYVMSMEFLTVDKSWRKKEVGVSVPELLSAVGLELMRETSAQAAIAPARKDVKVHEMAHKFNFESIVSDVDCRNFSCDLILGHRNLIQRHPDDFIRSLALQLWENKIDYTGDFVSQSEIYSSNLPSSKLKNDQSLNISIEDQNHSNPTSGLKEIA